MAAALPSRWPRSPFPGKYSRRFCGCSQSCGRSRGPHQHETADGHAFNRRGDCAQMPRKTRQFAPRNAAAGPDRTRTDLPAPRKICRHPPQVPGSSGESQLTSDAASLLLFLPCVAGVLGSILRGVLPLNMGRSDLLWTPALWVALVLTAVVSASGVRADPRDYRLEVERALPGGSVVVRLVNHKQNTPTPRALITGSALIGPGSVPTMEARVTARPIGSEGRYVVKTEPGMKIFTLRLNSTINEPQSIDSILDVR